MSTDTIISQFIKVLIVEDDPHSMDSLKIMLTEFGFKVNGKAHSLEQALELLNNRSFDIALIDIALNGSNSGIQIGHLLSGYYKIPFIFVTGNSDGVSVSEAIKAGPSAYLQKPLPGSVLFASIQAAIQNYILKKEALYKEQTCHADFFFVKTRNKLKRIDWKEVVVLSAKDNYTILTLTDSSEYYIRCSLTMTLNFQVPAQLRNLFMQINRSEAVCINAVSEIVDDEIVTSVKSVFITRSYLKEVKQRLQILS